MKSENEQKEIADAFGITQVENTNSTELSKLRERSNYPYCRGLITLALFLQWIAVIVLFISGIIMQDGYRGDREVGMMLLLSSIFLGIFNPYISQLSHLPFDAVYLLFEIRNKKEANYKQ